MRQYILSYVDRLNPVSGHSSKLATSKLVSGRHSHIDFKLPKYVLQFIRWGLTLMHLAVYAKHLRKLKLGRVSIVVTSSLKWTLSHWSKAHINETCKSHCKAAEYFLSRVFPMLTVGSCARVPYTVLTLTVSLQVKKVGNVVSH